MRLAAVVAAMAAVPATAAAAPTPAPLAAWLGMRIGGRLRIVYVGG